ncbi:rho GTPase-activating protein 32-like, partial [Saccoglossus kowalevskii]
VPLSKIDTNGLNSSSSSSSNSSNDSRNGTNNVLTRAQASVRVKKMAVYHDGSSRFPKLSDCAHFHYDNVEIDQVQ